MPFLSIGIHHLHFLIKTATLTILYFHSCNTGIQKHLSSEPWHCEKMILHKNKMQNFPLEWWEPSLETSLLFAAQSWPVARFVIFCVATVWGLPISSVLWWVYHQAIFSVLLLTWMWQGMKLSFTAGLLLLLLSWIHLKEHKCHTIAPIHHSPSLPSAPRVVSHNSFSILHYCLPVCLCWPSLISCLHPHATRHAS